VVTGSTVHGIRTHARRHHQLWPAGLEDRRHRNPGVTGLFSDSQRAVLAAALEQPPPAGGVWTGPQAVAWMAARLGRRVHPQPGWEMLRRLGWTSKVSRPRQAQADPSAQMALKTTSRRLSRPSSRPTPTRG
jgi:transposase